MDSGAKNYRRFLEKDNGGLEQIINDYYNPLALYLNSYVRDLTVAEDLAEDTFVKLATKKPRFSGKSSFKTWLYAIGRNIALDHIRANSKHDHIQIDDLEQTISDDEEIEQKYIREERKIALHRVMKKLKPEYRQVLWLTYFEDLDAKEISVIMKKSVNSVQHLLSRARLSLKSEIEKEKLSL